MPNVTVNIPAETYRKARVWAAENDTTVTRTVRDMLEAMPRLTAEKIKQERRENLPEAKRAKLLVKLAKSLTHSNRIAG